MAKYAQRRFGQPMAACIGRSVRCCASLSTALRAHSPPTTSAALAVSRCAGTCPPTGTPPLARHAGRSSGVPGPAGRRPGHEQERPDLMEPPDQQDNPEAAEDVPPPFGRAHERNSGGQRIGTAAANLTASAPQRFPKANRGTILSVCAYAQTGLPACGLSAGKTSNCSAVPKRATRLRVVPDDAITSMRCCLRQLQGANAVQNRLDFPTTHDCPRQSSASAGLYPDHQQRLTRAQQQRELEKRIAHAQESQVAHVNAYLVDVWRREIIRWKNVERVAARALRGID